MVIIALFLLKYTSFTLEFSSLWRSQIPPLKIIKIDLRMIKKG